MTTRFVSRWPSARLEARIAKAHEELDEAYDLIVDLAVTLADRKGASEEVAKVDRMVANAREARDCLIALKRYAEEMKSLGY